MMKRILTILTLALISQGAFAQSKWGATPADSLRCFENYNNFGQLANARQYLQAYDYWNSVYNECPAVNKSIYIYGSRIVEAKIEAIEEAIEATPSDSLTQYREILIDQLIGLADNRLKYFPEREAYVMASKAQDMFEYRKETTVVEVFNTLDDAMNLDASELSAVHFWTYFLSAVELNKMDSLDLADIFDKYNQINEAITVNTNLLNQEIATLSEQKANGTIDQVGTRKLDRDERLLTNYEKVLGNVEKALRSFLTSCDVIARVYNEETYEENKDDEVWIRRAVRTLGAEYRNDSGEVVSCRDNPLYFTLTERLYQMNPSTEAARNMGRLALVRSNYQKAVEYFSQAAEGEVDPLVKSEDNLKRGYALLKLGALATAKSATMAAIRLNPASGEAHLQLSAIYASASDACGTNAFEKQAVYWAAINQAQQARSLDPSLSSRAQTAINAYIRGLPDKTVSFQLGYKEGDTYTIGCWINETITAKWY